MLKNRRIVLARRPKGAPSQDDFRLETAEIPILQEGQLLIHNHWLSLDPYMRIRMNAGSSYAEAQLLNETMVGGTVGEVIASRNSHFAVGDHVVDMCGWQEYGVSDGSNTYKVNTQIAPLSAYLGVLGMPGITAWYGLNDIIQPKAGETIVVSAAGGAVGSVVGQLAKQAGSRVIGIAGGAEKCGYVVKELQFDLCLDYKSQNIEKELKQAAPNGIQGAFENVGGVILDAVLASMAPFGRIALCGMIAGYDGEPIPIRNPALILMNRLKLQGFIVSDHIELWPKAINELSKHLVSGAIHYRESIVEGIENAPQGFIGMLHGENFGKQLVKLI